MSYLKAGNLERFSSIEHGFGTASSLWPEDIILMSQRHTNNVVIIEDDTVNFIPVADAMLTKTPNKLLGVKTADCLPILLYNPVTKVAGVIHAGWRGLVNMVILNTMDKLRTFYDADPGSTYFSIGPGICKNCYEVGMEVIDSINTVIEVKDAFRQTSKDQGLLDTRSIAERQIQTAGVPASNISHVNLCTRCSPGFYSHRAGSKDRQVSYIKIR
jgi:YfiH family protein